MVWVPAEREEVEKVLAVESDTVDARCPLIGGNGSIGIIAMPGEGNRLSHRGRVGGDGVNGCGGVNGWKERLPSHCWSLELDHAPSSSLTRKDMVWVPAEREEVEKVLAVERIPLMLDVHS